VHYLTKVEFNAIGTTEILVFVTWPLLCILGAIYNRRKKRAEEEKVRADLMREHGSWSPTPTSGVRRNSS
jgi:hypothetical protein